MKLDIDKYRTVVNGVAAILKKKFNNFTTAETIDLSMEIIGIVVKELMDNE